MKQLEKAGRLNDWGYGMKLEVKSLSVTVKQVYDL